MAQQTGQQTKNYLPQPPFHPSTCAVGDGSPSDAVPPPHPASITPSTKSPTKIAPITYLIHKSYYALPPFVLSEGSGLYIRPPKVGCTTRSRSRRTPPRQEDAFTLIRSPQAIHDSRSLSSFPRRREPTARTPRPVHSPEHPTTSPVIPAEAGTHGPNS